MAITLPKITHSLSQPAALERVRTLRYVVPVCLFVVATVFEFWEHWREEGEFILLDRLGALEVLIFGLVGPIAVYLTISYLLQIMSELDNARSQTAAINRNLEEIVAARTAALQVSNEELAQANLRLRQLDQMKSDFVALVSHELRAPLTALNGGLEVALQNADTLPPPSRRILEAMASESRRLTQLVQNILDVSRLEAGRLTLNLGPVAVAPLLRRSAELIIGDRRPILWHLPAQIPPIWADEVHYEQIIRNLLRNADKYSPAGAPVEVHVAVQEDGVRVEIVDHGAGITPEVQAVMFERFTRGQTGESAPTGWGLGLYFARKLTEAQGGQLTARSPAWPAAGVPGAAFAVTFPLAAEAPEELEDG